MSVADHEAVLVKGNTVSLTLNVANYSADGFSAGRCILNLFGCRCYEYYVKVSFDLPGGLTTTSTPSAPNWNRSGNYSGRGNNQRLTGWICTYESTANLASQAHCRQLMWN